MKNIQPTTLEKASFAFNNFSGSLQQGNRSIRRSVKGIWNRRLELFCGFIPALLVFVIAYGKKFKS